MPAIPDEYKRKIVSEPPVSKIIEGPEIRLALGVGPPEAFARGLAAPEVRETPSIYLAHKHGGQGENCLMGIKDVPKLEDDSLPALLVSYYYLPQFFEHRHRYYFRDWVMDSGAFSAHNSGVEIDLMAYIDKCKELIASDPQLVEVYSLDVIGDWKASLKNTEVMWKHGVPAIPCYHFNEPWSVLTGMAKDYPKIALGGVAAKNAKRKLAWASECFGRVWPKKIHGFALCSEAAVMGLPFHSVDATSWEIGPCKYGNWRAFGNQRVSVRGSRQNLRAEVQWYIELERKARLKWKKQMEELEALCPSIPLSRQLRDLQSLSSRAVTSTGSLLSPSVRLVGAGDGQEHSPAIVRGAPPSDRHGDTHKKLGVERHKNRKIPEAPTIRLVPTGNTGRQEAKNEAFGKKEEEQSDATD